MATYDQTKQFLKERLHYREGFGLQFVCSFVTGREALMARTDAFDHHSSDGLDKDENNVSGGRTEGVQGTDRLRDKNLQGGRTGGVLQGFLPAMDSLRAIQHNLADSLGAAKNVLRNQQHLMDLRFI